MNIVFLPFRQGAYEPPKAAKKHETCTICQAPSQSKFIVKYFPYKETEILLLEAAYGTCVMTKQQWWRISLSRHVQLRIPRQLSTPFFPKGCNCPYFNFLLHIIAFYHTRFLSRLRKTHELHLQIFKCCDVIWIVMELLLRHLWWLISS